VPDGLLPADPAVLRIAVDALLENAVKYTETGDGVELRARTEPGEDHATFMIEVSDSGPGVPLEAAASIFERSSRALEGERPGLGTGLAIVDAIATAHGGSCTLEPSSGGSRFASARPASRLLRSRPRPRRGGLERLDERHGSRHVADHECE
jgi:two-component system, OmpR family, sensor kinase